MAMNTMLITMAAMMVEALLVDFPVSVLKEVKKHILVNFQFKA